MVVLLIFMVILTIITIAVAVFDHDKTDTFFCGFVNSLCILTILAIVFSMVSKHQEIKTRIIPQIDTTVVHSINGNDTTYTYIFPKE